MTYYENNHVNIPHSMQVTAIKETTSDPKAILNNFVQARLVSTSPANCKKLMVSEIEDVFKEFAQESINIMSLSRAVFGRFLQEAINTRKLEMQVCVCMCFVEKQTVCGCNYVCKSWYAFSVLRKELLQSV